MMNLVETALITRRTSLQGCNASLRPSKRRSYLCGWPSAKMVTQLRTFAEVVAQSMMTCTEMSAFLLALSPMIDELHGDGDYLFWPDLVPAHCAHATVVLFQENNIKFVTKDANPPNVPQLQPIEDIWLCVKREVYANSWEAENLEQLKRRVKKCLHKMNWEPVRKAILQIKSKLRKAADNGALSLLHQCQ